MKKLNEETLKRVEDYSEEIEKAITSITDEYCSDIDEYVDIIDRTLRDEDNPVTDEELDKFSLNLSTLIYYTSVGAERLSVKDDVSRSIYKEAYNTARTLIDKGTVADKNTQAELDTMEEHIANIIYNKSYKIVKAKVEAAQELLGSVKKVMSRRMSELSLSQISTIP